MQLKETVIDGQILSKGVGFGKPIFLDSENLFEKNTILEKDVEEEISKFKKATKKSKKQILGLKESLSNDKLNITFDILNTHLEILNDPLITSEIINRIKSDKKNVEAIFSDIISEYKKKIQDPFFKEKVLDIADVFKRISTNIRSIKVATIKNLRSRSIILSNEIIPSDVFEIDEVNISAFICFSGSYESHAAIIARSKNIPFLSKVDIKKLKTINFQDMIVDADLGKIIINPTRKTYEKYNNLTNVLTKEKDSQEKVKLSKSTKLFANISNINEVDYLSDKKLSGIGLLRTEFLFLDNKSLPSEDLQFKTYKKIAQKLQKRPFIIRLFDLGADKNFYNLVQNNTSNFFDSRGVDFLLKNKAILENQLKAILRASSFGNIHLLIPFVKDIEEIKLIKKYIVQLQKDIPSSTIKIGSMIETPAAALTIDEIIKEVDFISIGTNDLTRYTLASQNIVLHDLHPALLELIKKILASAKENKKPSFLCGEILSHKNIIDKLINIGLLNFSVAIKHIDMFEKEY